MPFEPGKSGNPRGSKKARVVAQQLTSALNEAYESGDKTKLRAVIDKWIANAIAGDQAAINAIADRMDGKPAQAIIGGDEDDPAVKIERIERVIIDPRAKD